MSRITVAMIGYSLEGWSFDFVGFPLSDWASCQLENVIFLYYRFLNLFFDFKFLFLQPFLEVIFELVLFFLCNDTAESYPSFLMLFRLDMLDVAKKAIQTLAVEFAVVEEANYVELADIENCLLGFWLSAALCSSRQIRKDPLFIQKSEFEVFLFIWEESWE